MKRILTRWLAVLCVCTLVFGYGLEAYAADVVEDTTVESESRQEENLQEQEEEIDEDKDSVQEATDDQDDDGKRQIPDGTLRISGGFLFIFDLGISIP